MDIESDDSEHWEDFFGSSTDLTPSLLGIYDTLTSNLVIGNGTNTFPSCIRDSSNKTSLYAITSGEDEADTDNICTADQLNCINTQLHVNLTAKTETYNNNSTLSKISSEIGHTTRLNKSRSNIQILSANVQRIIAHSDIQPIHTVDVVALQKQSVNSPTVTSKLPNFLNNKKCHLSENEHKKKLFHIPLSKVTCKLSQTGNEIVQTFEQEKIRPEKNETLALNKGPGIPLTNNLECKPNETILNSSTCEELLSKVINNEDSIKNESSTLAGEDLEEHKCICLPATEPLISYKSEKPKDSITSSHLHGNADAVSIALDDSKSAIVTGIKQVKFSLKESNKVTNLILPEISKLKHRPLSSLSLCSTSSSSSSGSGNDHISCKHSTSYLASVESLADQSENELMEVHAGMSVFERACLEIVDSERSYVNDLGEVIRGYLSDWKERACLRYSELQVLFANIEDVYEFSITLLKQLHNSGLDPVKISNCFLDMKSGFDVYTTYCTSYPEAIQLLTKLLQATHTNALLTSTQKMLQHTLPLGSYLLKPVQRILKYHLLLDNLRKHCDIKEVMQAYEIMRQVARNIDQVKRKLEQQTRVKELSGILDGWLGPELTVLGELRLEGVLMEHNKPRRVLLFSTMLIIAKAKEDQRLQFKSYVHQNNLMLSEHLAGEPTSFYVIPYDEPRNQIKLTAKNRDQKRLWTQQIKSVLLEKFDNIPLRAKELVYQLGDEEDHSTDKIPWKWSLYAPSTLTYLERRNQYRRSEIRNRSKVKRKTISNPTSNAFECIKDTETDKTINALKSISKSAESINEHVREEAEELFSKANCKHCKGIKRENENSYRCNKCIQTPAREMLGMEDKSLKKRSKSVPRISSNSDQADNQTRDQTKVHNIKSAENSPKGKDRQFSDNTKPCNHKTLPKRFTSLRKQKFCRKENSTFYMALNELEEANNTVLKITESSENISPPSQMEENAKNPPNTQVPNVIEPDQDQPTPCSTSAAEKARHDAQIVSDLLKNSKEFDRFCSKLQKKRPVEKNSPPAKAMTSSSIDTGIKELPPRPPSKSPPPLDIENTDADNLQSKNITEPIYETLRRNVHVPYKFSPILNRSKSLLYYKPRDKKAESTIRPESDYVTLVYSCDDVLQNVDNEPIKSKGLLQSVKETYSNCQKMDNVTNKLKNGTIRSDTTDSSLSASETNHLRPYSKSLLKRLLSSSTLNGEDALYKSTISDCDARHSVLHLQGSEAVGERIAHVDYADPQSLFSAMKSKLQSSAIKQRDSVFSFTSSNDSVNEQRCNNNFEQENCTKEGPENDFRDSAVYSDDNDRKLCPTSGYKASIPPPIKPKPINILPLPSRSLVIKPAIATQPLPVIAKANSSSGATRSWVLQQIENFNK